MPYGGPFGCRRCGGPFFRGFYGPILPWGWNMWGGPGCCRGRGRRW